MSLLPPYSGSMHRKRPVYLCASGRVFLSPEGFKLHKHHFKVITYEYCTAEACWDGSRYNSNDDDNDNNNNNNNNTMVSTQELAIYAP
jgi:hypothetical protein